MQRNIFSHWDMRLLYVSDAMLRSAVPKSINRGTDQYFRSVPLFQSVLEDGKKEEKVPRSRESAAAEEKKIGRTSGNQNEPTTCIKKAK